MTLRSLHDFELALVAPCAAMTRRGLRTDERVRAQMIADLTAAMGPHQAKLNALVIPLLQQHRRIKGRQLFRPRNTDGPKPKPLYKEQLVWWVVMYGISEARAEKATRAILERFLAMKNVFWEWNPGSDDQNKIVLYSLLKLPRRTKDGILTTDEDALKSLLAVDRSGVVEALLAFGKHHTLRSMLERMAPSEDGRLRTWYNIAGTETGRFSSTETFLEVSTNLQNLAAKQAARSPLYDVRRAIVPDAGEVFLYADLSQAEARVVAALSGDHDLLERWKDPHFDVHRWTAAHIFNKGIDDVTAEERVLGKTARHALNYGLGWAAFLKKVNGDADITGVAINATQAKQIVAGYHALHPRLQAWWQRVGSQLDRQGYLTTCLGRRRTFFGRRETDHWLDATHREAIAFEPQSTVADLLNRGLLRFWTYHDSPADEGRLGRAMWPYGSVTRPGRLLAQVHDAVLVSCPTKDAEYVAAQLVKCLEEELEINGIRLTIPVDVKMSAQNWSETTLRKVRAEAVAAA